MYKQAQALQADIAKTAAAYCHVQPCLEEMAIVFQCLEDGREDVAGDPLYTFAENVALCITAHADNFQDVCLNELRLAIFECVESVPGIMAAADDCVNQLTGGTTLQICPNSCYEFSKSLVSNPCTGGNYSLVAQYAPQTYADLMQLESALAKVESHCVCLPWDLPPSR